MCDRKYIKRSDYKRISAIHFLIGGLVRVWSNSGAERWRGGGWSLYREDALQGGGLWQGSLCGSLKMQPWQRQLPMCEGPRSERSHQHRNLNSSPQWLFFLPVFTNLSETHWSHGHIHTGEEKTHLKVNNNKVLSISSSTTINLPPDKLTNTHNGSQFLTET